MVDVNERDSIILSQSRSFELSSAAKRISQW